MKNIINIWAEDLDVKIKKNHGNRQTLSADQKVYTYLLSVANILEMERVTLRGLLFQLMKSVEKDVKLRLKEEDDKRAAEYRRSSNATALKPTILKGEQLISFDKYVNYQENLNYALMLHCIRI